MKLLESFLNFFSSVKLALFTLGCLSVTSIIGTIIPQKESFQFYVNKYGAKAATFFQLFDLTSMYTSWWFLSLLGLLSINLIVCSIDRFPKTWQQINRDNLRLPIDRIRKLKDRAAFSSARSAEELTKELDVLLGQKGWKPASNILDDKTIFFSQKMAWSRLGVYLVHLSILIIFIGAIYGQRTGFRGSIMLPEQQSSNVVFAPRGSGPIDLGFTIRCESFHIEFYDNFMPKEYTSKLTVLENDAIVLQKDIEVNDPLQYKGITFYQSSYEPFRDFFFNITDSKGQTTDFTGEFRNEITWEEQGVSFGIINLESVQNKVIRMKIWFNDSSGEPTEFWMKNGERVEVERGTTSYLFSAKQRYATGLQVAKDPGVWLVYLGFGILIAGLYVAFFMSHRRLWLIVEQEDLQTKLYLAGTANKNKSGFTIQFKEVASAIAQLLNR